MQKKDKDGLDVVIPEEIAIKVDKKIVEPKAVIKFEKPVEKVATVEKKYVCVVIHWNSATLDYCELGRVVSKVPDGCERYFKEL